jgi:hypothetical protein
MRSSENKKTEQFSLFCFFYFKPPFFSFGWKRAYEGTRFDSTIFCDFTAVSFEKSA